MNLATHKHEKLPNMQTSTNKLSGNVRVVAVDGHLCTFIEFIEGMRKGYALEVYNPCTRLWKTPFLKQYGELDFVVKVDGCVFISAKAEAAGEWAVVHQRCYPVRGELQVLSPMPTPRCGVGAVTLGGMIYAIGGYGFQVGQQREAFLPLPTMERFNPALDFWEELPTLQSPRIMCRAVVESECIYIIGGLGLRDNVACVERYDPRTNSRSTVASMPTPRCAVQAVAYRGCIYVFGGVDGSSSQTPAVERYDPSSDGWCALQSVGRSGLTARSNPGLSVVAHADRMYSVYIEDDYWQDAPQMVLEQYTGAPGQQRELCRLPASLGDISVAVAWDLE
jgi:N-acetylneuraminic acid mutarotase